MVELIAGMTSGIVVAGIICYILEVTIVRKWRIRQLMKNAVGQDSVLYLLILLAQED